MVILRSPNWTTLQPCLSISKKQSDLSLLSSKTCINSSSSDSKRNLSHCPSLTSSNSTSFNLPIVPLLTLTGQSAFRKTVWTSSCRQSSRIWGNSGWSPCLAIRLDIQPSAKAFHPSHKKMKIIRILQMARLAGMCNRWLEQR